MPRNPHLKNLIDNLPSKKEKIACHEQIDRIVDLLIRRAERIGRDDLEGGDAPERALFIKPSITFPERIDGMLHSRTTRAGRYSTFEIERAPFAHPSTLVKTAAERELTIYGSSSEDHPFGELYNSDTDTVKSLTLPQGIKAAAIMLMEMRQVISEREAAILQPSKTEPARDDELNALLNW